MTVCINYRDKITIVEPMIDGNATEYIKQEVEVPALFFSNTGYSRTTNHGQIDSDAYAYIDSNNQFVRDHWNRLEEMLVVFTPFGGPSSRAWYRIIDVQIGQGKLLTNDIDNIVVRLKKSTKIDYVSEDNE